MPRIWYLPDKRAVEVATTETILQASLRTGIPHTHACGGMARCSTCRVLILNGLEYCVPRNASECTLSERLHFSPDIRLACQTTITGDITLRRLVFDAEDVALTDQRREGETPTVVGQEKWVAILFADIRGFTTFAEPLLPYDVVHVLNRYFHTVGPAIAANGGCIDNYIGDGLLALFGVDDAPEAAFRAVKAGLAMLKAVEQLKSYLKTAYGGSFDIRIGIHYGEVVVGAVGAAEMKRVTAIGDAVNLASRIEAANKRSGTQFLISEACYRAGQRAHRRQPTCSHDAARQEW